VCLIVVVILAEDRSIQEKLLYYDLKVQTIAQVAPIQLYAASVLSSLFAHLGLQLAIAFIFHVFLLLVNFVLHFS